MLFWRRRKQKDERGTTCSLQDVKTGKIKILFVMMMIIICFKESGRNKLSLIVIIKEINDLVREL